MGTDRNLTLHAAVAAGIIRVIKQAALKGGRETRLHALYLAGTGHLAGLDPLLSAEASGFILEFVRDGLGGLAPHSIRRVLAGDQEPVWRLTNDYLALLGHPPVGPADLPAQVLAVD